MENENITMELIRGYNEEKILIRKQMDTYATQGDRMKNSMERLLKIDEILLSLLK